MLVGSLAHRLDWGCSTVLSHQHGDHFAASGKRIAATLDRLAGSRFDAVIACSDSTAEFLRSDYGYASERVISIRNGWAGEVGARKPAGRPTVVCVARLRRQKDHPVLLRAFAQARRLVPNVHLRLAGDGPEGASLRALCVELNLESSVEFLGQTDDVWSVLAEADLFALASRYEPLGIAALEAMAAGVPVIATSVGGLKEIVGGAGLLVEPGDVDGLAGGMVRLLTDAEERSVLADRGRRRAAQNTIDRTVGSYFDAYEALIAAHD